MKKILFLLGSVIIIFGAVILWWISMLMAPNPNNNTPVIFVVNRGDGIREISNNLKNQGLIKDPIAFFLLVKRLGVDTQIQAGDFRLNPSMTAQEVVENLTHGRLDTWITIPEGFRAEQIADVLEENIPTYDSSWNDILAMNEGYLFPDTYLIPVDANIELIVNQMRANFDRKFKSVAGNNHSAFSKDEIVTIASLVERETLHPEDRPIVASVILNRLSIGMKLDIDATVQYALGYNNDQKNWWKKNLTFDDLEVQSPYNTYINPGLPPGPIANPGIASIKAVLNPARTNYLYYVSDENGFNHYAETLSEHNENIEKYL